MWLLLPWKWNLVVRVDEIGTIYLNLDKENRYHRSGDPCWPFDTVLTRQAYLTSLRQSDRIITVSSLTLSDDLRVFLSSRLFNHAVSPWGELSEWWGEEMQWLNIDGEKLFLFKRCLRWGGVRLSSETYLLLFSPSESSCWGVNEPATECLIGRAICLEVSRDLWRQLSRSSSAPSLGSSLIRQTHANTPTGSGLLSSLLVFGWVSNNQSLPSAAATRCEGNPLSFCLLEARCRPVFSFQLSTDGLHSKLWILIFVFANGREVIHWLINLSWAWLTGS